MVEIFKISEDDVQNIARVAIGRELDPIELAILAYAYYDRHEKWRREIRRIIAKIYGQAIRKKVSG
jgi:hypothetical protein